MVVLSGSVIGCAAAMAAAVPASFAWTQWKRAQAALTDLARLQHRHAEMGERVRGLTESAMDRDRANADLAARSRFLATVSHEVRTPISGVLGIADLLAGTPLSREQRSYVTAIKTSGEALLTLIDDVLDFSRIEAGRLTLAAEIFDPTALVENVVELLAPRAHGKGLDIASFVGRDVPSRLVGDPHRLRQVLLNLAGNAVKFTERGGVGLAIGRDPDGRFVFAVSDTGPGVSADKRGVIFDEFEQAEGPAAQDGSGLGLAIVKRIVSEMGGELGVGERAGGGALFAFRVDLPQPGDTGEPRKADRSVTLPGHRSLIVSAEAFQSAYLAGALADQGSEVVRVSSPVEAVAMLQRSGPAFNVLFVDCAGGEDETRAVAAVGRLAGVQKTVLMFSPFERRMLRQPFTAGFDEWLVKPIRRSSLLDRLGSVVADRHPAPDDGPPASRLPGAKILLAEDNPINALIARTALERSGAEVVHVTDGESAYRAAEAALAPGNRPFDAALMDISMPLLDGLEATRRIRLIEQERGIRPMRIVATTAHAFMDTRRECERAGMDEVLTKPIDPFQLRRLASLSASSLDSAAA